MSAACEIKGFSCKKHEHIALKNHPEFDGVWIQDRIVEDRTILGLGREVVLYRELAKERVESQENGNPPVQLGTGLTM